MRFADVTEPKLLSIGLTLQEPHAIVETLVRSLANAGAIGNADEVAATFHDVEKRYGTWGYYFGTAFPHLKTALVDRVWLAIATLPDGVDWRALDNLPVRTVFLMLAPALQPRDYLQLLKRLGELCRPPELQFLTRLGACQSPEEAWSFLLQMDQVKFD